jgi:ABC-type Fe2+-enterobactin transport system substrate-binding protein
MTYTVIIKHHDEFSQAYLQGCEQSFDAEQQAQEYIQTFEDWEQDLLEIDFNPF